MNRQRQIDFLKEADERFQARWAKRLDDPKFVEKLRCYDSEPEVFPTQRCA